MDYREYLDKARLKQLAELQERYNQVYAKERAEAASSLIAGHRQLRRGLQNVGLAGRKGNLISGREKTAALEARRRYREYNAGLSRAANTFTTAAGQRMARQAIDDENRVKRAEAYAKWGDEYAAAKAEAEQEYAAKLEEAKQEHLQYAQEYQNSYNAFLAQQAQYQAWLQQQAAAQAAQQGSQQELIDPRFQGNNMQQAKQDLLAARADQQRIQQAMREEQSRQDDIDPRFSNNGMLQSKLNLMQRQYAQAQARENVAQTAYAAAQAQYAAAQAKIQQAQKISEPRTSKDFETLREAQYAQQQIHNLKNEMEALRLQAEQEQNAKEWQKKIQNGEGITKPKTRNEFERMQDAKRAQQKWIDSERKIQAARNPYIADLITLSDSEFAMRYDAAEKAYKHALQDAKILRKDSSSSMDDLSSDANDIEAKATAEFVKWQNAAHARDDAMGAFYNESVNTNMKLVPHAPTWASEKDHDGKNYTAAMQNHWDATQYARSHDTDGSKYMPLVNEWSFINGRTALNYTQTHAVSNFVNNAVSGGVKTQQYNAFVANCAAAFYNQPEGLTKNEREKMEAMLTLANLMTDEERARFNTILRQGGGKEADKYFEYLYASVLPQRFDSYVNNEMEFQTRDGIGKVFESVISIPVNLAQGVSGVIHTLSTGQEDPIAAKLAATKYNLAQGARDAVGQGISSSITNALMNAGTAEDFAQWAGSAGNFLYGTGMSMADSATVAAISAGIGSVFQGAGLAAETASKIGSAIGGSLLGASAFNSSYQEALDNGLDPQKARITAIGNGLNEMIFETLSIGTLLEVTGKETIKVGKSAFMNWLVNTAVQAGVEGSEEVFTDIANKIWDNRINGIFSEEMQKIREYVASGMSFNEAKEKVRREFAEQLGMSFLGGAISGGFMGGGAQFVNMISNRQLEAYGKTLSQEHIDELKKYDYKSEQAQEILNSDKITNTDAAMLDIIHTQELVQESINYVEQAVADGKMPQQIADIYKKFAEHNVQTETNPDGITDEEAEKMLPYVDVIKNAEAIKQGLGKIVEQQTAARKEFDALSSEQKQQRLQDITNETTALRNAPSLRVGASESRLSGQSAAQEFTTRAKTDTITLNNDGSVKTANGSVTFDFGANKTVDAMTDNQARAIRFAAAVANKTGVNIKVEQEFVGADRNKNGEYNPETNTIRVNLSGTNSAIYTMSHELTHYLQSNNKQAFADLSKAIQKQLSRTDLVGSDLPTDYQDIIGDYLTGDNTLFEALCAYEKERYAKEKINLTQEKVEEEVIARCCESFLGNSSIIADMTQNHTKSARAVYRFLNEIRADINALRADASERMAERGYASDFSPEQGMLEQFADIDKIVKLWENGLRKVAKKNKASGEKMASLSDTEYLDLAKRYESGDKSVEAELRKAVQSAAKRAGYSIKAYHGTYRFGRTKFTSQYGALFLSSNPDVGQAFSGDQPVRAIAKQANPDTMDIDEAARWYKQNVHWGEFRVATDADFKHEIERLQPLPESVRQKYHLSEEEEAWKDKAIKNVESKYSRFLNGEKFYYFEYNGINHDYVNSPFADVNDFRNVVRERLVKNDNGGGVYEMYISPKNMITVDANGAYYSSIPLPSELRKYATAEEKRIGKVSSDQLLRIADEAGYDTLEIKNVVEGGDYGRTAKATDYVVMNPESQAKSADLITKDDNGNIIPLSERFKTDRTGEEAWKNEDIRYSLNDKEYLALASKVKDGTATDADKAELRKAVDAAAKRAGYNEHGFHRTSANFYIFDRAKQGTRFGGYSRLGKGFYFAHEYFDTQKYSDGSRVIEAYLSMKKPYDGRKPMTEDIKAKVDEYYKNKEQNGYDPTYPISKEQFLKNLEWEKAVDIGTPSLFLDHFKYDKNGKMTDGVRDFLESMGYDGIITDNEMVVFDPSQIKSADLITKDDNGNIIPLSERFKTDRTGEDAWKNEDIRYSLNVGEERAVKIADGKTKDGATVSFIDRILDGQKTGETRTAKGSIKPNAWVGIYNDGKVYGRVKFGNPYWITKQSEEYKTSYIKDTNYDIDDSVGGKWYYPVLDKQDFRDNPIPTNRAGQWGAAYNTPTDEVITNKSGDPVMKVTDNGNSTMLSLSTYEKDGRATLKDWLKKQQSKKRISKEDAQYIIDQMEKVYNIATKYEDKYAAFGAWSRAEVTRDKFGKPVFSVIRANGEYPMNLDFSLVCVKRRALDAVLNEIVKSGYMDKLVLDGEALVKVNETIRRHGFETACMGCFVEAKRFRQQGVAETFVGKYNDLVKSLGRDDVSHFNFAKDETIADSEGIVNVPDKELDFTRINELVNQYKAKKKANPSAGQTVEEAIAMELKMNPSSRRLVDVGDFMSTRGMDAVAKDAPSVLTLYNKQKGTGGPKAVFGDMQYLNDVERRYQWTPEKAYKVGGVRVQSFSDFVPRMFFDYCQMVADLSAKKLPAHAYTKEESFVKLFGLTGMKINMSLFPKIANDGLAAGLMYKRSADGDIVYENGEPVITYAWAGESFDYETAKQIQADAKYGKNCGTIAVGISDEHIARMLDDPTIRMIIPYHKSSLNPVVAEMMGIDGFTDYTDQQRTKKDGKAIDVDFAFNQRLHEVGDPKAVVKEYLAWCEKNGYTPKFEQFKDNENYYKLLEDFALYDEQGNYCAQEAVKMVYPEQGDAFGSMDTLLDEYLKRDNDLQEARDAMVPMLAQEIIRQTDKKASLAVPDKIKLAPSDTPVFFNGTRTFTYGDVTAKMYGNDVELDGGKVRQRVHMLETLAERYDHVTVDASSEAEARAFENAGAKRVADEFSTGNEYGTYEFKFVESQFKRDSQFDAKQKANFAKEVLKQVGSRRNFTDQQMVKYRAALERAMTYLWNSTYGKGDQMAAYDAVDRLFDRILNGYSMMTEADADMRDTLMSQMRKLKTANGRTYYQLDVTETQMSEILNAHDNVKTYTNLLSKALGARVVVKQVDGATMLENTFKDATDSRIKNDTVEGDMPGELLRLAQKTMEKRTNPYKSESNERATKKEQMWDAALNIIGGEKSTQQKIRDAVKEARAAERNAAKDKVAKAVDNARLAERMHEGALRAKDRRVMAERESDLKRRSVDREARLKQQFRETTARTNEERLKRDMRKVALKWNQRLVKMLANPTEASHVPVQLAQAVSEYAQRLNELLTTSVPKSGEFAGMEKQTQKGALNAQKIIDALNRSYADEETIAALKAEDPSFDPRGLLPVQYDENGNIVKDETLVKMINGMDSIIQGKHLTDLTEDELRFVLNTMRGVIHTVTDANKVTVQGEQRNVYRASRQMANEVNSATKVFGDKSNKITKFLNRYVIESLGLRRIAKLYSGSNENAVFVKMVDDLNEGALELERIKQTLRGMFNEVTNRYAKEMDTWYGKNAEWIDTGLGFKITKGMRVSLAMHILNAQNLRNVEKAGLRIPNMNAYRKGNIKEAYKNGKVFRLTKAQAQQIVDNMTEAEKAYFEVAKEFFHKRSGFYINRTSLKLLGYSKAVVENYFPIQTDDAYRTVKYDDVRQTASVEHPGFLESRKGTANVMYLNDITAVVNRQIDGVAKYAGLAIPMRNWNNIMNAWLFEENEDGEWVRSDDGRAHDVLERRMGYTGNGKAIIDYVDQFITDLTSPGVRDANEKVQAAEFAAKLTSNYVKAVLTLNARVALSQLASVPTAAAEIPWKYIAQSFGGNVEGHLNRNASNDLIDQYTPIFAMRRAGTQTEVSEVMKRKGFADKAEQKLPGLLGWITAMDVAATRRLWYACERWVKGETNIPVGSDAFYKEVAKRYERVIQNTQPNFTVLQRSPVLRSKNAAARIITMFGTQRMQNGGIIIESAAEVVQAKDAATRKSALKRFGRALSGQITAAIVLGLSRAIVAAVRGRMRPLQDDDKDITVGSVSKYIMNEIGTSIAGSFMYVGEIYDFVSGVVGGIVDGDSGYETSFALPAAESLSTIIQFFKEKNWQYFEYMSGDHTDNEKWLKTRSFVNTLMTVASYATGLPLANASKTILNGAVPLVQDIVESTKTGELNLYLHQSGKLDSAKTAANYKEWTNLGKKGSVYLAWENRFKEDTSDGLAHRAELLFEDRELSADEKAILLRMSNSTKDNPLTSKDGVVYKADGTVAVDFTTLDRYRASTMLSDKQYEGFLNLVDMGVAEDIASTAFIQYNAQKKQGSGANDRFRDWLFSTVKNPEDRAKVDMAVVGNTVRVEGTIGYNAKGGIVYNDKDKVVADFTSDEAYRASQMGESHYEKYNDAVKYGMSRENAILAVEKHKEFTGDDDKDNATQYTTWVFNTYKNAKDRAVAGAIYTTKPVTVKDGRTYDENGYIYRDYTSAAWYKLSNRTLSKDGVNKRYEAAKLLEKDGYTAEKTVAAYVELDKLSKKSEWQKWLKDNGYTNDQIKIILWSRGWAKIG